MDPRVVWAIGHMEHSLAGTVSVSTLARAVNLSESRFSHLFREETGHSPSAYLRRMRLERARALLERTFLTVKEVMANVGFRDPSHFAREFRRFHGISARQLRRQHARSPSPPPEFLLAHLAAVEAGKGTSADQPQRNPPTDSRSLPRTRRPGTSGRTYRTQKVK